MFIFSKVRRWWVLEGSSQVHEGIFLPLFLPFFIIHLQQIGVESVAIGFVGKEGISSLARFILSMPRGVCTICAGLYVIIFTIHHSTQPW